MKSRRLNILSKAEINELYDIPCFTTHERQSYFALSKKEQKTMNARGSRASKVHFIMQLGYFKAASQFFNCTFEERQSDVKYILQEYFEDGKLSAKSVSKQTRQSNQTLIAKILGYKADKLIIKDKLSKFLDKKAQLCINPINLFHDLLCYSSQYKLMLLGYTTLQDLIGAAITKEELRLGNALKQHLPSDAWKALDSMINLGNDQYLLSALKKDPKSFDHKQVMGEVKKLRDHYTLYQSANNVLPKIKLSNTSISYYASLALHYSIARLQEISATMRAIYILCYVHHRYQKINDNLMVSYFHYVTKFRSEAKLKAQDYIFKEKIEINDDSKQAATVLRFFDDESISDTESFGKVRKRAYKHIKKGKFSMVADYMEGLLFDFQRVKWDEISKLKHNSSFRCCGPFNVDTQDG